MTGKERVLNALNHISSKVPMDFDGTNVTGMHCSCVANLRDYYGLKKRPVKVREPYQMLGLIDDDLRDIIGGDTIGVHTRKNLFGFEAKEWKEWRTPQGLDVLVPVDFNITETENDILIYPEGDTSSSPSAKMPKTGYFFDAIIRQQPIDDDNLNPEDNLEEFGIFSQEDVVYFKKEISAAADTGRAVVATFGGTALGDIALVPAPFLKKPKGIRDITEWYMSLLTRSDYIHKIFEKQTDIALKNFEIMKDNVGDLVDVVFLCGTDFGTQISTFCSKEVFRELYMPYYKKVNNWIHKNTNWKTFKHSCGAIEPFIPLLTEAGFDILNPVQCSAAGMEPETLKEKHGDNIVFWGGGVDTQNILPFGTPSEVREQVLQRCEIFSKNGGFVFNSIHNIQAKTPVKNIVAMLDAVKEFNK